MIKLKKTYFPFFIPLGVEFKQIIFLVGAYIIKETYPPNFMFLVPAVEAGRRKKYTYPYSAS